MMEKQMPMVGLVKIGNFLNEAPNGIAFIKDDAVAFVMDPGGPYRAGVVAPDDSYHRVFLPQEEDAGALIEFQWSRVGDIVVARLESQVPGKVVFRLDRNWPDFSSVYAPAAGGITGEADTPAGKITWALQTRPTPLAVEATAVTLALGGVGKPACFVAGFGALPACDGVDEMLAKAREDHERRRPRAEAATGDIVGAITDNLNNSRVYSTDNKMTVITVSRRFGDGGTNDSPYFCWDSFFNGLMASLDNPEAARDTVRAMLASQSPEGLVPNFTHWEFEGNRSSMDRSQPPVGAMCVWKMHLRQPSRDFLREVYPKLALWHEWWLREREHDDLLCWGSTYAGPYGALKGPLWETGWDDTPHFEGYPGVEKVGNLLNCHAVDLNALWAMDAHYLALIADALGKMNEASRYRRQAEEMNERINARLWNEELGVYCSRFWDAEDGTTGEFLTRITPANFYPLMSGAASPEQARRVLEVMTDPEQFWGERILPTVSKKDPAYFGQRYWHGTIWGPVNYLVWLGVKRYASPELQREYAQKSVRLFMNTWLGNGQCGENFLSLTGEVGGNRYYTWGALMCLIGVESVMDIADDGTIVMGPGYNEAVTLRNIPVAGEARDVEVRFEKPVISLIRP